MKSLFPPFTTPAVAERAPRGLIRRSNCLSCAVAASHVDRQTRTNSPPTLFRATSCSIKIKVLTRLCVVQRVPLSSLSPPLPPKTMPRAHQSSSFGTVARTRSRRHRRTLRRCRTYSRTKPRPARRCAPPRWRSTLLWRASTRRRQARRNSNGSPHYVRPSIRPCERQAPRRHW